VEDRVLIIDDDRSMCDVLDAELEYTGGCLRVPREPGLGVRLDTDKVARLAQAQLRQSVFYDDIHEEAPRVGQIL